MPKLGLSVLAAVIVTVALSGCALAVRLPTTATATTPSGARLVLGTATGAPAVTDNEVATPAGPDEPAPTAGSAQAAVRAFAVRYINWRAADLGPQLRRLARDSVGQARSAMELAAGQTGADPELVQAGVVNRGRVEAVSALAGTARRYVVVTLESTTANNSSAYQGLAPAWHLAVATVTRRGGGWVISGWQPEN